MGSIMIGREHRVQSLVQNSSALYGTIPTAHSTELYCTVIVDEHHTCVGSSSIPATTKAAAQFTHAQGQPMLWCLR